MVSHFENKKVLIIGIESFTGVHLHSYLKQCGYDVYGTMLNQTNEKNIFHCDITSKDMIKSIITNIMPAYIINLAGISFVDTKNKELFYKINVIAVENILEAILEIEDYTPLKTILVSSATVYGNQAKNILDEEMIPNPINHYGISKLAMEQIAKTYFNKIDIVITRPFNYTGVGQTDNFLIPKIVSHYKENKGVIELGNTNVFREFNDVKYVCEIYRKLLESNIKNEIVNISSNRVISLKEVMKYMNNIAGYSLEVKVNPKFIRANEIISLSGSTNKLFKLLGVIEQKDFIETLKDMYND